MANKDQTIQRLKQTLLCREGLEALLHKLNNELDHHRQVHPQDIEVFLDLDYEHIRQILGDAIDKAASEKV